MRRLDDLHPGRIRDRALVIGKDVNVVERWLIRWAPLASVPAAALIIAAFVAGNGNSPNSNATAGQIIRFYTAHGTGQKVSAVTGALALVFLVFFALALSGRVRAAGASGWLANGVTAGAVLLAVGFLPLFTFSFILGNDVKFLVPASAQALNVLDNDYFLPAAVGVVAFGIVTGLAVAVSKAPARWMGWVLFAIGAAALVPPISFWAFLLTMLWALAVGIWLTARKTAPVRSSKPEASLTAA
jgi:hypothetical protein